MRMTVASALDTALDLSVVGGYTRLGYRIRSHVLNWDPPPRMDGRTVLVTGATSGLGFAAATGFARLGATVHLAVRNRERGEDARARILEHGTAEVHVGVCDLSHLSGVRAFVDAFTADNPRLDLLVNSAGVLTQKRELSPDGIELMLATNVIGPFLLTNLLIPLLKPSAPARIINVSSGGMYTQKIRVDDLQSERGEFDGPAVYARSKRAEVVLTELFARQLVGSGVVAHSMHPGWADTGGIRDALPRFYRVTRPLLRTADQGADTIVWLGAAEEPAETSGGFWHDRRRRTTHLLPGTRETDEDRRLLWARCEALSGVGVGAPQQDSPTAH